MSGEIIDILETILTIGVTQEEMLGSGFSSYRQYTGMVSCDLACVVVALSRDRPTLTIELVIVQLHM